MKVLVLLGVCLAVASAVPAADKWLTFPPTTATPTTTTSTTTKPGPTLPCQTEAPVRIPCPVCVNSYCTPDMCNQAVHVPYPGDCTKFCECDHTGAIEFTCPPGLNFNPSLQVCDWPVSAGCTTENSYLPGCPR